MSSHMYTKMNQKGMSSILFAMVFAIILSLLAVGFVTLVTNDQRQALDKTLSYQAQYAAETAVNRKAAELQDPSSGALGTQASCQTLDLSSTNSSASAKITCLTWSNEVTSVQKDNLGLDPFVTRLKAKNGNFGNFTIQWSSANGGPSAVYGSSSPLPAVDSAKMPILRIAVGDAASIDSTKIAYLVPTNAGGGANLPSGFASGGIGAASCSGGTCSIKINFSSADAWLSVISYGPTANITSITLDGAADNTMLGAQAEIDANALAQDVTKRVKVRVSLLPQTWNPGFSVSANTMCKDYRVDGGQAASASGAAAPCP